jgi:hypothetical protein
MFSSLFVGCPAEILRGANLPLRVCQLQQWTASCRFHEPAGSGKSSLIDLVLGAVVGHQPHCQLVEGLVVSREKHRMTVLSPCYTPVRRFISFRHRKAKGTVKL